jgi:hypothetical protein
MNNYEQQANEFLQKTGTTFSCEFLRNGKHFDDDTDTRDIYKVTLKRPGFGSYSFDFGQSIAQSTRYVDTKTKREFTPSGKGINNIYRITEQGIRDFCKKIAGTPPTAYSVLACVQKYHHPTFGDFCAEFGYDTDSRKAEKTYQAVKDEYINILTLFHDVMDELREIQ